MNYDELSIDELEAEIVRIENVVRAHRGEQKAAHDAMETKIRAKSVTMTKLLNAGDQTMSPQAIESQQSMGNL